MDGHLRRVTALLVAVAAAVIGLPGGVAWAGGAPRLPAGRQVGIGKPWRAPSSALAGQGRLPELGGGARPPLDVATAVREAKASGRPVVASALTTATQLVTAQPDGVIAVKSYVLPVRVATGRGWVPVNTSLRPSGGRLAPAAVPGDGVSFSAGGTGPMAEIWHGSGRSQARLALWWPGPLPAPDVSGPSATYRNVLPA